MNKKRIAISGIAISGIVAVFTFLVAIPAVSAVPTLHFVPQDITVPGGYGNSVNVEIRINLSADDTNFGYGQFGFSHNPLCGNIISRTINTDIMTGVNPDFSVWNTPLMEGDCWDDTMDWCTFDFWLPKNGPTDLLYGNFTIQCNSSEYCTNDLNFGHILGCSQGWILMWEKDGVPIEVVSTVNGTFTGGEAPPPETFEKELVVGWNMVSLPLYNETDMTVANIIADSLSGSYSDLYKYDAVNNDWVVLLSSEDEMQNGVGYFIYMTAIDTWSYSGIPYNSVEVSLSEGLNCIGWTNTSANINATEENALGSITDKYNYVAQWNNAPSPKYEVYEQHAPDVFNDFWALERGGGYWIAAKEDCTLTYT